MSSARSERTVSLIGLLAVITIVDARLAWSPQQMGAQEPGSTVESFSITAHRYRFEPTRIEVFQGDVVKVELRTTDIAHSWTVDDYRIAKRVEPHSPVTFEFRADKAGRFPFYCSLQTEDGCRRMRGELVVKPRK